MTPVASSSTAVDAAAGLWKAPLARGAAMAHKAPPPLCIEPAMPSLSAYLTPILLLVGSNIFMTFAWYGHLKFKTAPLLAVIAVSWLIALPEYILQVPANRMGHAVYSAVQLKTLQEIITLFVFVVFSVLYLGEAIRWNHLLGFALIIAAAFLIFMD